MNDKMQGISHDRILMRVKDYLQIVTTVGALLWGGLQIIRSFDRMNMNISILQQQVSSLQQMVVTSRHLRNPK